MHRPQRGEGQLEADFCCSPDLCPSEGGTTGLKQLRCCPEQVAANLCTHRNHGGLYLQSYTRLAVLWLWILPMWRSRTRRDPTKYPRRLSKERGYLGEGLGEEKSKSWD